MTPTSADQPLAPAQDDAVDRARDRDLGFGSVVARESRARLLNRDGTFNVQRRGLGYGRSLSAYHWLVTITWPRFLWLVAALLLASNAAFAVGYFVIGPSALSVPLGLGVENRYAVAFFFSVQTFATIGYGQIAPVGTVANLLVAIESYYSILLVALVTGLVFARFSRPTARVMFSDRAVIAPFRSGSALMLRLVNARQGQLIDLRARVTMAYWDTAGGQRVRRFTQLALEREGVMFFPLAWTLVHAIAEGSPLQDMTERDWAARDPELLVLISGIDDTSEALVHARTSYRRDEIVWGAKFADLFEHGDEDDGLSIDVRRLSMLERAG